MEVNGKMSSNLFMTLLYIISRANYHFLSIKYMLVYILDLTSNSKAEDIITQQQIALKGHNFPEVEIFNTVGGMIRYSDPSISDEIEQTIGYESEQLECDCFEELETRQLENCKLIF
ncbi:AraC family transcriptional regulator [Sesbania bispinosa]|nr:AraC family transcriptional regulator [Sesbania bispinosa]